MIAQSKLARSFARIGKKLFQSNISTFSSANSEATPTPQQVDQKSDDSVAEHGFKFHQDWEERAQIKIKEQLEYLDNALTEQQKKRVKLLSSAYLNLNLDEVKYFNTLMRQRVNKSTGIDLATVNKDMPALKQYSGSPIMSETRADYEARMDKLWPMGQRAVSELFSEMFGAATGGFGAGGAAAGGQKAQVEEEKPQETAKERTHYDMELTQIDAAQKIKIIKEVRQLLNLGLKEAKETVEKAPILLKKEVKKEEAEELKAKLEAIGCSVTFI